ncbi:GNAT family N-acetyltransferase [Paenibacillus pasadenensis]|uniref:GNAT family N-acetyltransferase n=1 Tax=Paenibacillus pasadenensis TaxID=217090 RepID=UPI002040107D|nr:GNAT family N-acetyltransferase [Paenibacillus pasadenensis]MCM3746129.1 GNAT family N-acetyltransferase [Paenibacillus pasadenensis]
MRIEHWSWKRPLSEASWKAELELLLARCLFDASRAAALLDRYRTESGLTLDALCFGDKLAGLAGWRMMQEAEPDETITAPGKVELLHLAVAPEFERQGIGTVLLHQVLQKSGAAVLVAETDAEAVAFYRRTGCTIINLGEKYPGKERFRCELRPYASRTAEDLDFEAIALWPQSREEAYYLFPSGSWPLDADELRERAAIRQFPTVLLDAAGLRAAYANIFEFEGQLWIGNVIVNPIFRGKGAAQGLLLELCRLAEEQLGAHELYLICHNPNTRALLLYNGLGWEPCGLKRMNGPDGVPLAGIKMRKELKARGHFIKV